jgi:hypothetical protein
MDAFIEALEAPIGDFETVNVDTPNKQTHKEKLEVGAVLSLLLDAADNIISHHYYGCLSYLYRNNGWLLISSSFSSMLRLVRNTHINNSVDNHLTAGTIFTALYPTHTLHFLLNLFSPNP